MRELKDSSVAQVRIGFDGRVHKYYKGPYARERFLNERRMLRVLEEKGCPFVPKITAEDEDKLYLVTTNCGRRVDKISPERMQELFEELETYGVRHDDQADRNVTYSPQLGRFCLIDFEFATLVENGEGLTLAEVDKVRDGAALQREQTQET
jgi:predicted Ser/Thr protein kinase